MQNMRPNPVQSLLLMSIYHYPSDSIILRTSKYQKEQGQKNMEDEAFPFNQPPLRDH